MDQSPICRSVIVASPNMVQPPAVSLLISFATQLTFSMLPRQKIGNSIAILVEIAPLVLYARNLRLFNLLNVKLSTFDYQPTIRKQTIELLDPPDGVVNTTFDRGWQPPLF